MFLVDYKDCGSPMIIRLFINNLDVNTSVSANISTFP